MSNIEITLPTSVFKPILAQNIALASNSRLKQLDASEITIPGALVRLAKGCMRGHGTYLEDENLMSSVAGQIEKVNQLIRVNPIKMRYQGEIGDVVLGRIIEVQQKRWKVETNSRLHSALLLTSVNLPGGELRRKCIDDELAMREYLKEGDLVSAEVQQCFQDGALSLHTRSLKYGKLGQGILVKVRPHLVQRSKNHICNLPIGASVILGCNGYIWVARPVNTEEVQTGGYVDDLQVIKPDMREAITRVAGCVRLLARNSIPISSLTINKACDFTRGYPVKDLLKPDFADEIAERVIEECREEEF